MPMNKCKYIDCTYCDKILITNCLVLKPSLDSIKVVIMLPSSDVTTKTGMMIKVQTKTLSYWGLIVLDPKCVIHSNQLRT